MPHCVRNHLGFSSRGEILVGSTLIVVVVPSGLALGGADDQQLSLNFFFFFWCVFFVGFLLSLWVFLVCEYLKGEISLRSQMGTGCL